MSEPTQLPPPAADENNRPSGKPLAWVATLLAIASLGASAYIWKEITPKLNEHAIATQKIKSLTADLNKLKTQVNTLASKQTAAPAKTANQPQANKDLQDKVSQQQALLKQQTDSLSNQQHQLDLQSNNQQQQQLSLQNTRTQVNQLLHNYNNSSRQWLLNEAEYLVRLAHIQLTGNNNTATAINLLKSAAQDIKAIGDENLIPVEQAIEKDIKTLRKAAIPSTDSIINKINKASTAIADLSTKVKTKFSAADNDKKDKTADNKNQPKPSMYEAAIAGIKKIVVIKKINSLPKEIYSSAEIKFLKEKAKMRLVQAEWAAMHGSKKLYQDSLTAAQKILNDSLSSSDNSGEVKLINKMINNLKTAAIKIKTDDLNTSVASIQEMINKQQNNSAKRSSQNKDSDPYDHPASWNINNNAPAAHNTPDQDAKNNAPGQNEKNNAPSEDTKNNAPGQNEKNNAPSEDTKNNAHSQDLKTKKTPEEAKGIAL